MASDAISVTLNPKMTPDKGLENTPWILRSFAQQENLDSLLNVFQITANFNAKDGKLSGLAGCNNYFTSYSVDGDQLAVSMPIGATRMMCPDPQMALEDAYFAAMEGIGSYEVTDNTMEISNTDGNLLLVFQVDPFTLSEAFTREGLANISYLNEFAESGIVQLVDGIHRQPVVKGSATDLVVMLTNHAVFGDFTGDGAEDAVVVLVSQSGGSGSFYDLIVVRKQGETLSNIARIQLGDRVQIKNLHIDDGEIVVNMLTQGPDDPMCCPTQNASNRYVLESGELMLVRVEVIE
jgi:heat shock protein HslJ